MKKLAAIDIGTNSIKLLVAAADEGGVLEVVSPEKSPVRLGTHTLTSGRLSPESIEAGVCAIEQFLRSVEAQQAELVRAVARRRTRRSFSRPCGGGPASRWTSSRARRRRG